MWLRQGGEALHETQGNASTLRHHLPPSVAVQRELERRLTLELARDEPFILPRGSRPYCVPVNAGKPDWRGGPDLRSGAGLRFNLVALAVTLGAAFNGSVFIP
jgi:hypothetical protein